MTQPSVDDNSPNTHSSTISGSESKTSPVTWRSSFSFKRNFKSMLFRPGDNYAFIDGLRAIAILMIMLYHSFYIVRLAVPDEKFTDFVMQTPWYLAWIWNLEKSLEIFFVISGFLISGLLMREHKKTGTINLKSFYWRRYLRLTPLYLFAILLYELALGDNAKNLWANILYVNNFLPLNEVSMPWTWSLAVEEQFYLVFPLLLFVILPAKRPLLWLKIMFVIAFAINFFIVHNDPKLWDNLYSHIFVTSELFAHYFDNYYNDLHTRFGAFICGIVVAYLYFYHRSSLDKLFEYTMLCQAITVAALAIVIGGFMSDIYIDTNEQSLPYSRAYMIASRNIFSMALAWLILSSIYPKGIGLWLKNVLSLKLWFPIAQLSYSMYLFHYSFATIIAINLIKNLEYAGVIKNIYDIDYWWFLCVFIILFIVSFVWGSITFVLIEKPFMQLRDLRKK